MRTVPSVDELLDHADAERAAGRADEAARGYDRAITRCRDEGDLAGWTRAVLGAASVYVFGAEPGKLPAQLYDVLVRTTADADRARLAAALARCWSYAGHAARAAQFADEAMDRAARDGAPALVADCLDAALAAHWGPDDLDARIALAARLDEVAAHLLDPDSRLRAALWGLQVACEALDIPAIHRHMRALEHLGEESPRARFFAASRRLMLELLRGRTDTSTRLVAIATDAARDAALPDAWMVLESMRGYTAVQSGDEATCALIAAECEEFAAAEGAAAVSAEAAFLWLAAGRTDRCRELVHTFQGGVLAALPRDVNWLLTVQCVLDAALDIGDGAVVDLAAGLLEPYAGRPVFNAGAVMFHGTTDDTLARAAAIRGDTETAELLRARALSTYERLGARWWRDRLAARTPSAAAPPRRVRLHPTTGGLWLVGPEDAPVPVPALRGLGYLRELLRRPGIELSALTLVGGGGPVVVQSGLGDVLDRQALHAYRHRLDELERDIAEAEEWSDLGRLDALRAERDALAGELSAATGLGGRARSSGSSQERARVAATKAISAAIARIGAVNAPVGAHLRAAIHTGTYCIYRPAAGEAPDWLLD